MRLIGNVTIEESTYYDLDGKHVVKHYLERDCENCPFGWECSSYEGECEDYGCYINYNFNVPLIICMLPERLKLLIKKMKGWE